VPAEARSREEGLKAEGLGRRSLDHLPDVDPHAVETDLHLIDEGDVDGAVDVLEQLRRLGHLRRRDGNGPRDHVAVEGRGGGKTGRCQPPDDLWHVSEAEVPVVRVFPLGGVGQVEVLSRLQPRGFEDLPEVTVGGAGVGGGLENDELPPAKVPGDGPARVEHVAHVRLAVAVQGGGHADEDAVDPGQKAEVRRGGEVPVDLPPKQRRVDVPDIAFPPAQGLDLLFVDIEPGDLETGPAELDDQGQAHVAQADDAHAGMLGVDLIDKRHNGFLPYP